LGINIISREHSGAQECWSSVQITKKILPTQPRIAQDLSRSNVVTITGDRWCTLVDQSWGLRPRTGIDDEANLKVMKISTPRLQCNNTGAKTRCHKCSTSEYSYTYDELWLLQVSSIQPRLRKYIGFGSDLEFPQHDDV
jgi:hypothetical protein